MIGGQNFAQSLLCRLCVLTGILAFAAHLPDSGNNFFETAVRSLSVPDPDDYRDHKCSTQEVVSSLLITRKDPLIIGNGSNRYLTKYLVCCEGYKPYKYNDSLCVPDCKGKCRNGICQKPDICKCFQGFVKNEDGECVQTCPLGCLNGVCNFDGSCTCNIGFELEDTGKYCKPRCQPECPLDKNCTRPYLCDCRKGYSRTHGSMTCEPQCNPPCGNGYCKGPNMCECYAGYNLKNSVCQAECSQICGNGTCTYKNHCECKQGYELDPLSTSCIPKCSNCLGGVCIAPEVCQCYEGFIKVNGVCKPHCKKGCVGGFCENPNICRCEYGEADEIGHCRNEFEYWCNEGSNGICFSWTNQLFRTKKFNETFANLNFIKILKELQNL